MRSDIVIMFLVAIEVLVILFVMKISFYSLGISEVNDYFSLYIITWQKLEYSFLFDGV